MPGVFKVLTASDIPAGGKNDITGPGFDGTSSLIPEEVRLMRGWNKKGKRKQ